MKFWSIVLLVALLATAVLAQRRHPVDPPDTLRIGVLRKPSKCSVKASKGADVTVHYRAYRWNDETPFDDTYEREQPITFKQNDKKVIPGLDMGVEGMCVGEVRRILIPHNLGYGELGAPGLIAPNTDLMYEVELIKSMTTFSNPWFWAGLFGLAAMYLIFEKLSKSEEASKAARFVEKKQAAAASSGDSTDEVSDKKND